MALVRLTPAPEPQRTIPFFVSDQNVENNNIICICFYHKAGNVSWQFCLSSKPLSYLFTLRVFFLLFLLLFLPDCTPQQNEALRCPKRSTPQLTYCSNPMVLPNGFFQAFKESEIIGVTKVGLKHPRLCDLGSISTQPTSQDLKVSPGCSEGTTWLSTGLTLCNRTKQHTKHSLLFGVKSHQAWASSLSSSMIAMLGAAGACYGIMEFPRCSLGATSL